MGLELNFTAEKASDQLKKFKKDLDSTRADIPKIVKAIASIEKAADAMSKSLEKSGNKKAAEQFGNIAREAKSVSSSIKEVKTEMATLSGVTSDITKKTRGTSEAYKQASKQVEKYEKDIIQLLYREDKLIQQNKDLENEIKKLKKSFGEATKYIKKTETELINSWSAGYKYEKKVESLINKNKELVNSNRSLGGTISHQRNEIKRLSNEIKNLNADNFKSGKINLDQQKKISRLEYELKKMNKAYKDAVKTARF